MNILKVDIKDPNTKVINKIVKALNSGQVVALPTDTSYGLCGNALSAKVAKNILKIKQRPRSKGLTVFVKDLLMAENIAKINDFDKKNLIIYLPGKFTFILKKKKILSDLLTGGKKTVGIRMTDFAVINKIMERIDFPIVATSANISNEDALYSAEDIIKIFKEKISQPDILVDGGKLRKTKPSTIVDISKSHAKILRAGSGRFVIKK